LVSCDGMGLFNSQKIHCENCCVKEHPNGSTSYYHKILCASIVHPDIKQDLQLAPEPIVKQDGATKNDCERNAGKRLRREHPHLDIIVIEDDLSSNAPHIERLKKHNMSFIWTVPYYINSWDDLFEAISGKVIIPVLINNSD
jgi:hypothetical protein